MSIAENMSSKISICLLFLWCFCYTSAVPPTPEKSDVFDFIFERLEKCENMENRIADLERTVVSQSVKLRELESIVTKQTTQSADQEKEKMDIMEVDGKSDKTQSRNTEGTRTNESSRRRFILDSGVQEQPVAFTAYLGNTIKNLAEGQTLNFSRVLLNDGNAYNSTTGIFTCPTSGLYLFSFFISEYGVHDTRVKLVVDGAHKVDGITEGMQRQSNDQGGNLAILRLTQGQSAWLEVFNLLPATSSASLTDANNQRRNTFSGVLLYAL